MVEYIHGLQGDTQTDDSYFGVCIYIYTYHDDLASLGCFRDSLTLLLRGRVYLGDPLPKSK